MNLKKPMNETFVKMMFKVNREERKNNNSTMTIATKESGVIKKLDLCTVHTVTVTLVNNQ